MTIKLKNYLSDNNSQILDFRKFIDFKAGFTNLFEASKVRRLWIMDLSLSVYWPSFQEFLNFLRKSLRTLYWRLKSIGGLGRQLQSLKGPKKNPQQGRNLKNFLIRLSVHATIPLNILFPIRRHRPIPLYQRRHAIRFRRLVDRETVKLHHGFIQILVRFKQFRWHGNWIVKIAERTSRKRRSRVEDLFSEFINLNLLPVGYVRPWEVVVYNVFGIAIAHSQSAADSANPGHMRV